jgi:hypothetical protein
MNFGAVMRRKKHLKHTRGGNLMASQQIYQFYSELEDYKPTIWRRFQVSGSVTVARFGYIVMVLYEMMASHLFAIETEIDGEIFRFDIPDEENDFDDRKYIDATEMKLSRCSKSPGTQFHLNYDFGDYWWVSLTLEEIIVDKDLPSGELPRVLEGAGYGIVEDCGGVSGLDELTKAFKTKRGPRYRELSEWLGVDNFDMTAFDLDDMNFRLKKLPRVYADIYERNLEPSKRSRNLLQRRY